MDQGTSGGPTNPRPEDAPDRVPSDRWATPFQTQREGRYVWCVALKYTRPLTLRQQLAGCASVVYADSYDALLALTIKHDELAETVGAFPAWSERVSGPPASPAAPADGEGAQ